MPALDRPCVHCGSCDPYHLRVAAFLRHRLVIPVTLGVVAIAAVALVMSSGGERPTLTEARFEAEPPTTTVSDLADGSLADGRDEAGNLDDREEAGERTQTVTDLIEETVPGELAAALAVDDSDACAWLVNVTDENPASLFLVAWPTGTDLTWEPFEATVPTADGDLVIDQRQQLELVGTVVDAIGELSASELGRLLGQERCGHDGIVIVEEDAVIAAR